MYLKCLDRFILLFFLLILAACKAQPVYNVEDERFSIPANASLQQVEDAIIKGCKNAGWRPQVAGQGKIIAAYSYKRNKYSAVVDITFDLDSYDIAYKSSSSSLKYTERQGQSGENFFTEYNPFDDEQQQQQADGSRITIHKSYNKWVKDLETSINAALAAIPLRMAVADRKSSDRELSQSPVQETVNCETRPDKTLSGQVVVNRSSANLRYGANSRCPQVGSVHKDETLTLLGAYGNWFYIQTPQNKLGWIYAPLVRKFDSAAEENTPIAKAAEPVAAVATPTVANTPPPPPSKVVKKKIAIAVIQFKTLNKEAQDIMLGDLVSETFTSALVNSSAFKIIERAQLDKVIKEMEFSQTGFIETSNAVEIGKMLHADAIITGSVALLGKKIQLNARIIDIESAYVISAETRTTDYSLENVSHIAREIVASLSQKLNN